MGVPVGQKVWYQYEADKFAVAQVIQYEPGKDGGDYLVAGFSLPDQAQSHGDVFRVWSGVGTTQGSFKL